SVQEGQSTRGEFCLNFGTCVFGGKLKFGGSALLPLNAALSAKGENKGLAYENSSSVYACRIL
ncbi:hypothetical protein P3435_23170, partial [Vibrio parahaemolyticus]|nr:hypothetical protein [Vibrio parahaemolyticus]